MAIEKKNILFAVGGLAVGAIAVYLIMKNSTGSFANATGGGGMIRKGAKGREILEFQRNANLFFGFAPQDGIPESGLYDKNTVKAVNALFDGTNALKDRASGAIDRNFVSDFNLLVNRISNNNDHEQHS